MELSRRDALAALGAAGATAAAGCGSLFSGGEDTDTPGTAPEMETLVALAEVLYPLDAEPTVDFVETYLLGRVVDEELYREDLASGVETLDGLADDEFSRPFGELSPAERKRLVQRTDLRSGESVPDGSAVERVNYHLIDELLFAFYSSPVGGELVGNTNPGGFPGGFGYVPEGGP